MLVTLLPWKKRLLCMEFQLIWESGASLEREVANEGQGLEFSPGSVGERL